MFTEIKILDTVQNKLLNIDKPCFGELYGIKTKDKVTVLGVQFEVNSKCDDSFVCSLPENIQFCGYFEAGTECLEKDKCYEKTRDMNTYPVLFLTVKLDVQNLITAYTVEQFNIHDSLYTLISEQDLYSEFLYLHVSGHLQFRSEATTDAIYESFSRLKDMILERICFSFFKKSMFLYTLCGDTTAVGLSADSTIGELYESSLDETELVVNKKKKSNNSELDVFNVGLIQKNTRETSGTNFDLKKFEKVSHAPVVILDKKHLKVFNTYLPINFLGIIQRKASLKEAHDILIGVVLRHLKLLQLAILEKIQTGGDNSLSLPETFHFFPQKVGHFVSRVYFKNDTENDLKGQRELLHRQLSLDMSSPKFRRANQFVFKDMLKKNGPLFNPHDGVRPTDNGGHVALVKGKYEYYHYCQNQMDDNGWGCAYRSLQTLASWFIVQGYTKPDSHVPTFQEIQKCLVDIGDKPSNFIGSKQWIGSTEVNFVLDTLFGITSKILFVSSGEEMASKGPELVNHFEMHGSPIMIGGGVLAHTILGVDYNQQTGDIRFLILDPHYTGGEDLKTIQNKGWCGWKKLDFWNKSAYYNMCLPQVPREF